MNPVELVACPYFTTSLYDMTEGIQLRLLGARFICIIHLRRRILRMKDNEGKQFTLDAGETVLLHTQDITIIPDAEGD